MAVATRRLHPAAEGDTSPLAPWVLDGVAHAHAAALPADKVDTLAPAPGERHYELLLRTAAFEVWVIAWGAGSRLPLHDHGESAGAFEIVQGELSEVHTAGTAATALVPNQLTTGARRAMAPGDIHEVHNPALGVAVSVHASRRRWKR